MEKYIEHEKAVKRVNLLCQWEFGQQFDEELLSSELEQIVELGVVHVVRCRDCKFAKEIEGIDKTTGLECTGRLESESYGVTPIDYCSYGERK